MGCECHHQLPPRGRQVTLFGLTNGRIGSMARHCARLRRHYVGRGRWALQILRNQWWNTAIKPAHLPADMEIYVVSPGSVGTTLLIGHICRFRKTNCNRDSDHLKHRPRPPSALLRRSEVRVVFVTGEDEAIYASLKRQGRVETHGARLGSPLTVFTRGEFQKRLFLRAVHRQHLNWTAKPHGQFLVLKYDEIWHRIDELAEFVGVKAEEFRANFPQRRPRRSAPVPVAA